MIQYLLYTHIVSGFTGLTVGLVPMLTEKGNKAHRISGLVFFWAMMVAVFASIPVAIARPNPFLLCVAMFTFQLNFTGYRFTKVKTLDDIKWYDQAVTIISLLASLVALALALYGYFVANNIVILVVLSLFAFGLFANGREDYKRYILKQERPEGKMGWWFGHIIRMSGTYIASVTAFIVVNAYRISENEYFSIAAWTLPGVIGGILIGRTVRYWKAKFGIQQ